MSLKYIKCAYLCMCIRLCALFGCTYCLCVYISVSVAIVCVYVYIIMCVNACLCACNCVHVNILYSGFCLTGPNLCKLCELSQARTF